MKKQENYDNYKLSIVVPVYNEENGITPETIRKAVRDLISTEVDADRTSSGGRRSETSVDKMSRKDLRREIERLTKQMNKAAVELEFEKAAELRDRIKELKLHLEELM